MALKLQTLNIPANPIPLAGLRYLPPTPSQKPIALLAHGFSAGKYSLDSLAVYLATHGIEAITFDFVGHKLGATGGEMQTIQQAVDNLHDAWRWLQSEEPNRKMVLVGHSMGAVASLQVAERILSAKETVAGVICLCTGMEPARGFATTLGKSLLEQRGDYVAGMPALKLLTELNTLVHVGDILGNIPVRFIAARQDVLISVQQVEALVATIPNAQCLTLETTHLDAPHRARPQVVQWIEEMADCSST